MPTQIELSVEETALLKIGRFLRERGYGFVTTTPNSTRRVLARPFKGTPDLRDIFGWNRKFHADAIDPECGRLLEAAGVLEPPQPSGETRCRIRFSTMDGHIFLHSGYPTDREDSVFFGPDTYRFGKFIAESVTRSFGRALDLGCGSGAGGISIARLCQEEFVLSDVNPGALSFSRVNVALNAGAIPAAEKLSWVVEHSDLFRRIAGTFDLILANPPFMVDKRKRAYRHGGGPLGTTLSERIVSESIPRLNPGGKLVLYTGSPIERGRDAFAEFIRASTGPELKASYREIDPDIFGEMLNARAYANVDRIAAIGAVLQRQS